MTRFTYSLQISGCRAPALRSWYSLEPGESKDAPASPLNLSLNRHDGTEVRTSELIRYGAAPARLVAPPYERPFCCVFRRPVGRGDKGPAELRVARREFRRMLSSLLWVRGARNIGFPRDPGSSSEAPFLSSEAAVSR